MCPPGVSQVVRALCRHDTSRPALSKVRLGLRDQVRDRRHWWLARWWRADGSARHGRRTGCSRAAPQRAQV